MKDPFEELYEEPIEDFFEDSSEDPFKVPKKTIKGKSLGTVFLMISTVFLLSGFLFATFTGSDSQMTSFFTKKNSAITIAQQDVILQVDEKLALEAVLTDPSAGTKSLTWTSSDTGVATVDQTLGIVTGVATGTSTITVTTEDGATATTLVTVEGETGTEPPPDAYEIYDQATLEAMPDNVDMNDPNAYVIVVDDFAVSTNYVPHQTYAGTFDGQGYTITLTSDGAANTGAGIFETSSGAVFKDVNIGGELDTSWREDAGFLVGEATNSTFINCNVSGTVSGAGSVGGLVGTANGSTFTNCSSSVDLTQTYSDGVNEGAGCIVGFSNNSTFENCSSSGTLSAVTQVGGIVGAATASTEIINCSSTSGIALQGGGGEKSGGLVGYLDSSSIVNSYATGHVTGTTNLGGLVGLSVNSTIDNSYATGTVDSANGFPIGGLVGAATDGTVITNCYATGDAISSSNGAGGLVGDLTNSTIANCYATGNASSPWGQVGGLVGNVVGTDSQVINSFATGNVDANDNYSTTSKGLVGKNDPAEPGTITNSYAYENQDINGKTVSSDTTLAGTGSTNNVATKAELCDTDWQIARLGAGFAYQADNYPHVLKADGTGEVPGQSWVTVTGSQASIDPNIPSVTSATLQNAEYGTHEKPTVTVTLNNPQAYNIESIRVNGSNYTLNGSTTTDGVTTGTITIAPPSTAGSDVLVGTVQGLTYTNNGTQHYSKVTSVPINAEHVYIAINDAQDLAAIQNHPQKGETGVEFRVMNDIDMSSISDFEPITDFNATFNGQGYTITNYNSTKNGIFATTGQGAVIKDTNVSGTIDATELVDSVGLLVGSATGTTIEGSSASGTINAPGTTQKVGLLVGSATDTIIDDSSTSGTVSGLNDVGGLVGIITNGSITDCYSTATVTSSHSNGERIGGLVGQSYTSSIKQSYATGDVTGWLEVGGLVGKSHGSTITATYATGDITANQAAGGLVGRLVEDSDLSYSYAIGSVDSNETDQGLEIGGLVGNTNASSIKNCFATGDVTGVDESTTHGLVGRNSSDSPTTVTTSYAYEFQTVNGVFVVSNPDLAGSDSTNSYVTNADLSSASWQNDLLTNDFNYQDGNYPQIMDSDGNILQDQTWVPIPEPPVGYETLPADQDHEVNKDEEETAEADSFRLFNNRINRQFNRIFTAFGVEEKSIFASN